MENKKFGLTSAQKLVYEMDMYLGKGSATIAVDMIYKEEIDFYIMNRTLNKVVQMNDGLRIELEEGEEGVYQSFQDFSGKDYEVLTFESESIYREYAEGMGSQRISVKGSLIDMKMIKLPQRSGVFIRVHHIIGDASSLAVLAKQINKIYKNYINGEKAEIQADSYIDHILKEQAYLENAEVLKDRQYWIDLYKNNSAVTYICDHGDGSDESERISVHLSKEFSQEIKEFCSEKRISEFTLWFSALTVYFRKTVREMQDFYIGTAVMNRTGKEENRTVGMFVNTIPLFAEAKAGMCVEEILKCSKKSIFSGFRHQRYNYGKLLSDLRQEYGFGGQLYDVLLSYQDISIKGDTDNFTSNWYHCGSQTESLAIHISDRENCERKEISYDYKVSCFAAEEIRYMHERLCYIIRQMMTDTSLLFEEIQVIDEKEKNIIVRMFNDTGRDYGIQRIIPDIFEEQVGKYPDCIAVMYEDKRLTYQELNERANAVAHLLRKKGVGPDDFVALIVERSLEMIVGIYGIIKAGGAYVPIDPTYPAERISYILRDCKPKLVLTIDRLNIDERIEVLNLREIRDTEDSRKNLPHVNTPDNLVYSIYTSGTTGKPKGVLIEHRNLQNLIMAYTDIYGMTERDTVLQFASVAFDQAVLEIFHITLLGGSLCLAPQAYISAPENLEQYMVAHGVTVAGFTPAYINELEPKNIPTLRMIESGGAAANPDVLKKWLEICRVFNTYGPTETTVNACTYEMMDAKEKKLPIGRPMWNAQVYILQEMNLCGIGIPGELCVAGDGIARGYLNREDLNTEKFIDNPFGSGRMYRTGDLAKWRADGNIEYLGRIDEQIKIRGYRIELGEIESELRSCSKISDAVAAVKESKKGDKSIIAYVCGDTAIDIENVKSELRKKLPVFMIPAHIAQIKEIPLTKNGKVDKKRLPDIEIKSQTKYVEPQSDIEIVLAEIYQEILEAPKIGIEDNFFDMGGHSLRAVKVINLIEQKIGVRIQMKDLFANPTIKELEKVILSGKTREEHMVRCASKDFYRMSAAQRRIYMVNDIDETGIAYNMPGALKLSGRLDIEKIRTAFEKLLERHEILRTSFHYLDGEYLQKIHESVEVSLNLMSGSDIYEIASEFVQIFDLGKAPLIRAAYAETEDGNYYLIFDMHHIISDGQSVNNMIMELSKLYRQENVPEVWFQYRDYSEWTNKRDITKQKEYWLKEFQDEIPVLDMPIDGKRTGRQSYIGKTVKAEFDSSVRQAVKKIALKNGATDYMVLMAALMITLNKYSGQETIIIGSPVSGRIQKETEDMLGVFVNTLAIKGIVKSDMKYTDFQRQICETCLDAFENQEYPFEELIDEIDVNRDLSRNPLFDVMLVLQNHESRNIDFGKCEVVEIIEFTDAAKFDLTFNIEETADEYRVSVVYCSELYNECTVMGIVRHLRNVIIEISRHLTGYISEIGVLDEKEEEKILLRFSGDENKRGHQKAVIDLFEAQVQRTPDSYAVVYEGKKMTYRQLNKKAQKLAGRLLKDGVKRNEFVVVYAEKSVEMVVGILAVLKAGGAYVPIDTTYPKERVKAIMKDCCPKAALTYRATLESEVPVIQLENEEQWKCDNYKITEKRDSEDSLYVIYTSGTTGKSKGAVIRNSSFVNMLEWYIHEFRLDAGERILLLASIGFDLAQKNVFAPLVTGGCLHIYNQWNYNCEDISREIYKNKITAINCAPSVFYPVIYSNESEDYRMLNSLRYLFLGGEAINAANFHSWIKSDNCKVEVVNTYGPTECTDIASYYRCKKEELLDSKTIPIGKPIPNVKLYIVNQKNQVMGIGMPGELCIAGASVSNGYLNAEEMNAEKFISNPFGDGRLYRTGDLVKWLPDGNIEFLGRIDEQVKIRGFRIELGEIEYVIRKQKNVQDTAVIVRESRSGEKNIYAYIVSSSKVDLSQLRKRMREELPEYMMPPFMLQIDGIPVNKNGKLDKKALPEICVASNREYMAPRNDVEADVADIFGDVLGIEQVGITDNFFELGGHSLKASKVVSRIEKKFRVHVTLRDLFSMPTVEQLSGHIRDCKKAAGDTFGKAEEKNYYNMSPAQKRMYMICQMDETQIAYNMPACIKVRGEVDPDRAKAALQKIVDRHEILRTAFFSTEEGFYQEIQKWVHIKCEYEICRDIGKADEIIQKFVRPFLLRQPPLIRLKILEVENEITYILFDVHHIVADGISFKILMREFCGIYNGKELKEVQFQYRDYLEWSEKQDITQQKAYWLKEFAQEPVVLEMPLDAIRPAVQSYAGAGISFEMDEIFRNTVRDFAVKYGVTEYMIFMSALMMTLCRYSSQEEIVIGCPVSGRVHKDTENIMGLFVNTLAIKGFPATNKKYLEFLMELKDTCIKALENQEYPFEELVEAAVVRRDFSRNPLFDVMLSLQDDEDASFQISDTEIVEVKEIGAMAKFDLTVNIVPDCGGYRLSIEYCREIFRKETVERLGRHYLNMLKNIIAHVDENIGDISVVDEEERHLIIDVFNDTEMKYDSEKTMPELFEDVVSRNTDKLAVCYQNQKLTYSELNEKVNQLANILRKKGVRVNDFVAVIAQRSLEMVIGILAVVKSGAAYVPIDGEYPKERIRYMIEDCMPKLILLAGTDWEENLDIETVDLMTENFSQKSVENPVIINKKSDLAYCIYTSGTSGRPKGVMIEHSGISNLKEYFAVHQRVTMEDRVLQFASFAFDAMVSEIAMSLLIGGTLYIVDEETRNDIDEFEAFITRNKITIAILPPQFLNIVRIRGLRTIITAGSETRAEVVWQNRHINVYSNDYGPTEATVCATFWKHYSNEDIPDRIPIGKPMNNKQIYILRGNMLCGIGIPGELCIAGVGIARGYLNQPELTAEKFVPNPFGGGKLYRTGDLAKWRTDGNIEYLGRIDDQVKIRGFRIELGEIESVLSEVDGIKDLAVAVREDKSGEKAISAYLVSNDEIDFSVVKEKLAKKLPNYMIPKYMMQINEIPVTRNGKVSKRELPDIIETKRCYVEPENQTEELILEVFKQILGVADAGILDSFFELGGDSLKAVKAVDALRRQGIQIRVNDLMRYQNVSNLYHNVICVREDIEVESISFFEKEYKGDKEYKKTQVYTELKKYGAKNHFAIEEKRNVNILQKEFISISQICANKIILKGVIKKEQIQDSLRQIINENPVLRARFTDRHLHRIGIIKRADNWYIPYLEDTHEEKENDIIYHSLLCNRELFQDTGSLSYVYVLKKAPDRHIIYMAVHHCVWDNMSAELFVSALKQKLCGGIKEEILTKEKVIKRKFDRKRYAEFKQMFIESIMHYKKQLLNLNFVDRKMLEYENNDFGESSEDILKDALKQFSELSFEKDCELTYIPAINFYYGGNSENLQTMGMHLQVHPILYDRKAEKLLGGQQMFEGAEEWLHEFDDILQTYYKEIPVINIRILFEDNYDEELYKNSITRLSADNFITVDRNNGTLYIGIPEYGRSRSDEKN